MGEEEGMVGLGLLVDDKGPFSQHAVCCRDDSRCRLQ